MKERRGERVTEGEEKKEKERGGEILKDIHVFLYSYLSTYLSVSLSVCMCVYLCNFVERREK